jgi:predicted negative regulator of RcsB-dependent stress response
VFAFADSKAAGKSTQAGQDDADAIFLAPEEARSPVLDDQKKAEDQKKKEKLLEIDKAIKELKMKYEKTDDPELKKKIKEKVAVMAEEKKKLMGNPNPGWAEMDELRKLYEKTDNPEKKKEIKMKIAELEKKKQMEETKKVDHAIQELKKKYEQTDDPELKKQIEKKIQELKKQKK